MDLHMPVKGGVAATREITRLLPTTQILVLTTLDDDETVFEAVRAGAHAYLLKDAAEDELLETIRALKRGESRLDPADRAQGDGPVSASCVGLTSDADSRGRSARASSENASQARGGTFAAESLNDKEEKILQLISEGMSNRQIADAMFLAEGTDQELCQPDHGKAARQYQDRTRHHVQGAVGPEMTGTNDG